MRWPWSVREELVGSADPHFTYITPILRGEWLFGVSWNAADGYWDTVHRLRVGLGPFIWELAWWSRYARRKVAL